MIELQRIFSLIQEMKQKGLDVDGDTLTSYAWEKYPDWSYLIDYPPGNIRTIFGLIQPKHERNTVVEVMERHDDETLLSDIDTTPMTIHVKCSSCHKVEEYKIIGEDLEDYTPNNDGTYTSIQGKCTACLTGNEVAGDPVVMDMSDEEAK